MLEWSQPTFRIDYVKHELRTNGFRTDPAALMDRVALEVAHALFAPVHERSQATYGAIVTDDWAKHASYIPEFVVHDSISCGKYRRNLSDGASGFLICENSKSSKTIWVPRSSLNGEAALSALRDDMLFGQPNKSPHAKPTGTDLVLIQRLSDGSITILHWDGITTLRNGHWSHRHYQYRYRVEEKLATRIDDLSEDMQVTMRHLLRFCVHVLSPAGCGATIVASLDRDQKRLARFLNCKNAILAHELAELTVTKRWQHRALAHLLAQVDGAMIIDERGDLKKVGAWLKPKATVKSLGGARQLTAEATSKGIASPIVTVSADGPVRVFHQGQLVADFSKPPK